MESRTYKIGELLELRGCQVSKGLASVAEKNPDIALIFRGSGGDLPNSRPQPKRQKDDSSATSDEVVFKGNNKRRTTRESLPRETPSREPLRELQQPIEQRPVERARDAEWKYRGRSDSDVTVYEPIAAPDNRMTQKNEGFQRFYKAVVSPTHVRVTAGGRIVPNTRGPPSPISKRAKDGPAADGQTAANNHKQNAPSIPGHNSPNQLFPPIMPQFLPAYAPGVQPMHPPFPFMPIAYAPATGYPFPQPGMNAVSMPGHTTVDGALRETQNTKGVLNAAGTPAGSDLSDKVKISPPDQFDHTKPFLYNGQWMYPIQAAAFPHPVGGPFLPFHLIGLPPHIQPHLSGQMMQQQSQPGMNPAVSMPSFQPSHPHNIHGLSMPSTGVLPGAAFQLPATPPVSSIRPSEITRKQIVSFKQSLKYHEDQLQYNRHQIDEKDMETKIHIFRDHIRRFEAILKSQLEHEAAESTGQVDQPHRSPVSQTEENNGSQKLPADQDEKTSVRETRETRETQNASSLHDPEHGMMNQAAPSKEVSHSKPDLGRTIGGSGKVTYNFPPDPSGPSFTDSCRMSSLPSEAVLAPPFQPRGYAASWEESERSRETQEESEQRLLAAAGWKFSSGVAGERLAAATAQLSRTGCPESSENPNSQSTAGIGLRETRFEVPYLVGTLPFGVDPRTAKDTDYKYVRPLTEEEVRARHLYWGQAPKSAKLGLPKYDGRHFYPASPVKETVAESLSSSDGSAHAHAAYNDQAPANYSSNIERTEADPFRPVTPPQQRGLSKSLDSDDEYVAYHRALVHESKTKSMSEDTAKTLSSFDKTREQATVLKSRENSSDTVSAGSHDKRTEKTGGARLLQAMLKKGSTSSAVSSTTVQGYLPQYKGHAAASLSPSMNKGSPSPSRDTSPSKTSTSEINDTSDGGALLTPTQERQGENRPPYATKSLEDHFRHVASIDVSSRVTA